MNKWQIKYRKKWKCKSHGKFLLILLDFAFLLKFVIFFLFLINCQQNSQRRAPCVCVVCAVEQYVSEIRKEKVFSLETFHIFIHFSSLLRDLLCLALFRQSSVLCAVRAYNNYIHSERFVVSARTPAEYLKCLKYPQNIKIVKIRLKLLMQLFGGTGKHNKIENCISYSKALPDVSWFSRKSFVMFQKFGKSWRCRECRKCLGTVEERTIQYLFYFFV